MNSVVVLMEKELESMDMERSQVDIIFGEHYLNIDQREQVTHFFQALEEAKQQYNHIEINTNPYRNRVPKERLQELSNRISTLTEEQKLCGLCRRENNKLATIFSFCKCRCWNRQNLYFKYFCSTDASSKQTGSMLCIYWNSINSSIE